ncbi:uncharacterized, partial [Tachysurus ichikawai]
LGGHAGDGIKDTEADPCWETEVYELITVITKDTISMMLITHITNNVTKNIPNQAAQQMHIQ